MLLHPYLNARLLLDAKPLLCAVTEDRLGAQHLFADATVRVRRRSGPIPLCKSILVEHRNEPLEAAATVHLVAPLGRAADLSVVRARALPLRLIRIVSEVSQDARGGLPSPTLLRDEQLDKWLDAASIRNRVAVLRDESELREARRGHLLRAWRATRDDLHERQDAALVRYVKGDVRVHSRKTDEDDRRELGRRVAVGGEHRDQWLDRSLADNDALILVLRG